ncbi:hypothetical protein scyTo_0023547, partial [Scyliorhinus torazame]|nr:hypothetical protein [Scyliorhinus torazame]
ESSSPSESRPQVYEGSKTKETGNILTPVTVVIFVIICSAMIVLLYFFYKWLVYLVIGIFALAAAVSLFNCLAALVKRIPHWKYKFTFRRRSIEVRLLILAVFCITMSIIWLVFRNDD